MKRYKDLYSSITFKDFVNIYQKEIRVNTKNKEKIKRFDDYYSININRAYNYIKNKNYIVDFNLQEQIITSYLADMNKYTENSEGIKNSQIYNSIPKELARVNNTFK